MNNNIIDILKTLEGKYLSSIDERGLVSLSRKDYSRAVLEEYFKNTIGVGVTECLNKFGLVLKTTPVSYGSFISVEPLRLCKLTLKDFVAETWIDSDLNSVLRGIVILPLIVEAKNLGQAYRKVGRAIIWMPNDIEINKIKNEWLWFQDYALKGAVPNKRGYNNSNMLTFPTEADSDYIHMKPHSTKGKFELDSFGNQVRRMAFYLNPSYLRNLILNN